MRWPVVPVAATNGMEAVAASVCAGERCWSVAQMAGSRTAGARLSKRRLTANGDRMKSADAGTGTPVAVRSHAHR